MMTKPKSKKTIFLKQVSLLPLFLILLLFSCSKKPEKPEFFSSVKQPISQSLNNTKSNPEFKGGIEAFYKFVSNNYRVPDGFKGKGKTLLKFMVEKDGSLSNFKIIKDAGFGTGEEAVRVLKMCPKWIPATVNGKPVKVQYSLPITLQSQE